MNEDHITHRDPLLELHLFLEMHRGYVKVYRRSLASEFWDLSPLHTKVWDWILLSATHEEKTLHRVGATLQPGELITTYTRMAEANGWKENRHKVLPTVQQLRTVIANLTRLEMVQNCNRTATGLQQGQQQGQQQGYLYLKVLHWADYQEYDDGTSTGTATVTYSEPGADSNNRTRKKKEEKSQNHCAPELDQTAFDIEVERIAAVSQNGNGRGPKPEVAEVWAYWSTHFGHRFSKERGKMISDRLKEGFTVEDFTRAIDAFRGDNFEERSKFQDPKYCFGTMGKLEGWALRPARVLTPIQQAMADAGLGED